MLRRQETFGRCGICTRGRRRGTKAQMTTDYDRPLANETRTMADDQRCPLANETEHNSSSMTDYKTMETVARVYQSLQFQNL